MRKRPPTVRACSIRARKLAKEGKDDSKKGKALAACAATTRRSRPRPKVAPATKKTCRRRAKALQSGKVGRSDRSKVAYRLTLCRKRKPSAKRAHRCNPSAPTAKAKVVASKIVRRTVRGATFRRRFFLVDVQRVPGVTSTEAAFGLWVDASSRHGLFGGFYDRPEFDASEVDPSPAARKAAVEAFANDPRSRKGW